MPERKQINFTIVPDEQPGEPRTYANFCAIAHTPFDFTLTFCEVMPLSEKEVRDAEANTSSARPSPAIVVPVQFVPNLISALQEHMRVFTRPTRTSGGRRDLFTSVHSNSEFKSKTLRRLRELRVVREFCIPNLHF